MYHPKLTAKSYHISCTIKDRHKLTNQAQNFIGPATVGFTQILLENYIIFCILNAVKH
jgi:hypothetical protein